MDRKIFLLCLLLLICWGASLKTLAPSIYIEDSGQFVSSAATLGHNHPPGYILYNLLAHIFTWFPLGEIALRVNLFSAACGLGVVSILFWFSLGFFDDTYVALITSLLFVFSRTFWFLASQSEVYQLNLLFFCGAIYLLFLERSSQKTAWGYLLFLWLGWSFNNHYLMILFSPLFLLAERWGAVKYGLRGALQRLSCLLAGYSLVLLVLPLRSVMGVPMDWGQPNRWGSLLNLLRRAQFQRLEFSRDIGLADKLQFVRHFFSELAGQFHPVTLLLALIGFYWLYRNRRYWLVFFGGLWLLGGVALIWFLQFPFNYENATRVSVYYLPVYWLTIVFVGAGLKLIVYRERLPESWQLLFLFLPLGLGILNFSSVSLRDNFLGYDQGNNLLVNLPRRAVLQARGNNIVFPLSYFQHVLAKRPDVTIYDKNGGVFPASELIPGEKSGPRFFTLLRQRPQSTVANPYGLLFREGSDLVVFPGIRFFRWRYQKNLMYGEYEVLAARYYFKGLTFLELGAFQEAVEYFDKSTEAGENIVWLRNNLGQIYLRAKLYRLAKQEFLAALRLAPFNPVVHYNLGLVIAEGDKDYAVASGHFKKALTFDPGYSKAKKALLMSEERREKKK